MSLIELFYIMFVFQMVCVICEFWLVFRDRSGDQRYVVYAILSLCFGAVFDLIAVIVSFFEHHYRGVGAYSIALVMNAVLIYIMWRWWRQRKKVMAALGPKSKALRDKIVRKLREVQQPSPVRVPS